MSDWDGKDRRADDARLAVLEAQVADLRGSQVSIHKRITDFKQEVKEDMRSGFNSLRDAIVAVGVEARARDEKARADQRARDDKRDEAVNGRLANLESWRNWLTGAYITGAAIISGWISLGGHKR